MEPDKEGGIQKPNIQITEWTNKSSKLAEEAETSYDFTLVDELFSFLDSERELLPILCGYFNKVAQSLLIKSR